MSSRPLFFLFFLLFLSMEVYSVSISLKPKPSQSSIISFQPNTFSRKLLNAKITSRSTTRHFERANIQPKTDDDYQLGLKDGKSSRSTAQFLGGFFIGSATTGTFWSCAFNCSNNNEVILVTSSLIGLGALATSLILQPKKIRQNPQPDSSEFKMGFLDGAKKGRGGRLIGGFFAGGLFTSIWAAIWFINNSGSS